jgi:hypothetical protein
VAAARRALLPFPIALTVLLTGCGGGTKTVTVTETRTVTTTVTTTTERPGEQTSLRIYFLRDGKVAPVAREVPKTERVAAAALGELKQGPTADERNLGLSSEFDPTVYGLRLSEGEATFQADELSDAAIAQVVYTLTQFPTVKAVVVNDKRYTRATLEDFTPAILVESPLPFEAVSAPLRVTGTANTFEATFEYDLLGADGAVLKHGFVTATSGSGTRGTFDFTIPFEAPNGLGKLVVYERSAADGSKTHLVEIPLSLRR